MRIALIILLSISWLTLSQCQARQQEARPLSLCQILENWQQYDGNTVKVEAVLNLNLEQVWLSEPNCAGREVVTAVSFKENAEALRRLKGTAGAGKGARVVVEGKFAGPAPFDRIDPGFPESVKEALHKGHKRYGHLGTFDSMIEGAALVGDPR